jgi:hypothetical protein
MDPGWWWAPAEVSHRSWTVVLPCHFCTAQGIWSEGTWQDTRQRHQRTKQDIRPTSGKQRDILWSPRTNPRVGGCEASSEVFHGTAESEWLCIVEESAPTQTEEETTNGLRGGAVGAPTTPGNSLPVNGRNGDTPIEYSGRAALRMEECDMRTDS